jgi:hypothetical protein
VLILGGMNFRPKAKTLRVLTIKPAAAHQSNER